MGGTSETPTIAGLVQGEDEVVNRLTLRADLTEVDPRSREGGSADVMGVLFLLAVQCLEMGLDCELGNSGRVIREILLQTGGIDLVQHGGDGILSLRREKRR